MLDYTTYSLLLSVIGGKTVYLYMYKYIELKYTTKMEHSMNFSKLKKILLLKCLMCLIYLRCTISNNVKYYYTNLYQMEDIIFQV